MCIERSIKTMNNNDLRKLGINAGQYNVKLLFNQTNVKSSYYCLNRIKCILTIYASWIKLNQTKQQSSNINIYDLINSSLSPHYAFSTFLHDFKYLTTNRELLGYDNIENGHHDIDQNVAIYQSSVYDNQSLLLSQTKEQENNEQNIDNDICDINTCFVESRHDRQKEYYTQFGDKLNQLFFTNSASSDHNESNESMTRLITAQEILDAAHSFVYHSMRIDINKLVNQNIASKNKTNTKDFKKLSHDYIGEELRNTIRKIKSSSKRYNDSNRYQSGVSKFMVNNEYKNAFDDQKEEQQDGNVVDRIICFVDGFFIELMKQGAGAYAIAKLGATMIPEEYDTDAFCDDFGDRAAGSNINNFLSLCADDQQEAILMNEIANNYYAIYTNASIQYSVGFRYFYWDFYKNNQDEVNVIAKRTSGQNITETNEGYKLCDWYIPSKYSTFKNEIINNTTAIFSIGDWNLTRDKAGVKLKAWLNDDYVRKLVVGKGLADDQWKESHKDKWLKLYGIADGTVITVYHIMALMFYCNYTAASYEFSATFRRIYWNESDASLKKRHSNLAQWARLLRECVDCWGLQMKVASEEMYFHGISKTMLFKSSTFRASGPVSTTVGLFRIFIFYSPLT